MKRVLFLVLMLTGSSQGQDTIVDDLEITLQKIDSLTSYGPLTSLYGLDYYLTYIEESFTAKCVPHSTIATLVERLFSRYAYRDGTKRSRIYTLIQQRVLALLASYKEGRVILRDLAGRNPHIAGYIEALSLDL